MKLRVQPVHLLLVAKSRHRPFHSLHTAKKVTASAQTHLEVLAEPSKLGKSLRSRHRRLIDHFLRLHQNLGGHNLFFRPSAGPSPLQLEPASSSRSATILVPDSNVTVAVLVVIIKLMPGSLETSPNLELEKKKHSTRA